MHPSLQQTDFSFLFPPSLPSLSALKRAVKLVPSDAPAQWPTTTTAAARGEKPTVAWSRASAGGRTKLGQAGEVVGRAHHIQLANVSGMKSEN